MRATDRTAIPTLGQLPQYTWRSHIAEVQRAQRTAEEFPIPREGLIAPPRGVLRGGNYPTITAVVTEDPEPANESQGVSGGPQQSGIDAVRAARGSLPISRMSTRHTLAATSHGGRLTSGRIRR